MIANEISTLRIVRAALPFVLVLFLCACPSGFEDISFIETDVGTVEKFWAWNVATEYPYPIQAVLLAETESCLVYAECDGNGKPKNNVNQSTVKDIARKYERTIYPKISNAFGEIAHITPKGKITLLLLDIVDGLDPATEGYVAGYFYPQDMEEGNYSNKRDMLYIDTDPGLLDKEGLYSTVAHELQHLINYSSRVLGGKGELDLWINEGLSTAAEYIYGGDPAYRVALYNLDLGETIKLGNNFFVWYGYWEVVCGDSLANYSTAYLFFQWLRIHAANGGGIYKEILNSPYRDFRAVTEKARERIPALGLAGPEDWETLLRTWMLANIYQSPNGLYGYRDKIKEMTKGLIQALLVYGSEDTNKRKWEFYPGEGILSVIEKDTPSYTPPAGSGSHIRYVGFNTAGTIDTVPPYEGEYLLTFNANTDNTARDPSDKDDVVLLPGETGYLANILDAAAGKNPALARLAGDASAPPVKLPSRPLIIDAGFLREKQKWEKSRQANPED
ncbi:MAG: hypothetical protein LBT95_07690 [Treponema sp.]|jgi:hypothetical protein|nr:hypothetical protein [Treponema sp.]